MKKSGIKRVIDVRLNNSSQLAGFAKRDDLRYFLRQICDADYVHLPVLAPGKELLDGYRKKRVPWEDYEREFLAMLAERRAEWAVSKELFDVPAALLCSEPKPDRCHRRLVAEYLRAKWGQVEIIHL